MTNETTTTKFQVGQTYMTRSIGDHNCKVVVTVARRTAQFVTTTAGKRLKVSVWNGVEHVKPWGSYSMAPSVSADQRVETSETVQTYEATEGEALVAAWMQLNNSTHRRNEVRLKTGERAIPTPTFDDWKADIQGG